MFMKRHDDERTDNFLMNLRTEQKKITKNTVFFVRLDAIYRHVVFAPTNLILKQCKFSAIVGRVMVSFFVV
jgi:methyl coenzyme M reductase subunit C